MAETILVELLKTVAEKLGSQAYNKIVSANDIDSQIKELRDVKNTLEATLLDADSAVCSHSQQDMLEKLENGLAKIIHFQDAKAAKAKQQELMKGSKFTKKVRTFFSSSNQLITPYKDARKIKAITRELSLAAKNYSQFGTIVGSSSASQKQMLADEYGSHTCTDLVIGRDGDRDNIVRLLLEPPTSTQMLSVASIVGIGGVGKTTLAQYVFNDARVQGCFDVQLWVSTTQDFNVKDVLQKILASATDEKRLECEMDQLQHSVLRAIAGKKFLLVLDGIWDHGTLRAKWLELRSLLGVGDQGSKVLLTTRDDTVVRKIGSQDPYMLCDLQEEECWLLFQYVAYTQWHEPGVEAIGKKIAKMCPKVPLVIRVIGSLLAGKLTVQEWEAFRNDQLTNFASYGRDVMGTLKLSYDELGRELKLCVAFCSLFPRGLHYEKSYLIHLWIAMGYVKIEYANQSPEDVAEGYVLCLKKRGFFKNNMSNFLCMHNLMHELVLSIAGFKYKVANSTTAEFDERVCHVSFWPFGSLHDGPWKVPSSLFKIKQLQSFLLPLPSPGFRFIDHEGIFKHDVFLSSFQSLRSLRIHGLGINKLPRCVGDLIQLRYLDLSNNPICKLPTTITHLVNLYLLNLSYCKSLEELPEDLSKLVMLRHLNLHGCDSLSHMPKALGSLTELKTLDRFVVNNSRSGTRADFVCGLKYLNQLDNLKGLFILFVISQSKDIVQEAKAAKMESKENIMNFYIKFRENTKLDEMMLDNLRPNANLRSLGIMNYVAERLPSWMRDQLHWRLPNLVEIRIYNCKGIKHLCSFGRLSHLRLLELVGIKDVEYIENNGGSDTTVAPVNESSSTPLFPSLTMLILSDMPKLKGWFSVQGTRQPAQNEVQRHQLNCTPAFPRLQELKTDMAVLLLMASVFMSSLQDLSVTNCTDLEAVPEWIGNLSSLETLYISGCPKLTSLPHAISNLLHLKSLYLVKCSLQLAEKCSEPTGEDWPKIQHIPNICIEPAHDNGSQDDCPKLFVNLDKWYDVVDTVI